MTAADDFGVDQVRILVDSVLLNHTEIDPAPYHAVWNTSALARGGPPAAYAARG